MTHFFWISDLMVKPAVDKMHQHCQYRLFLLVISGIGLTCSLMQITLLFPQIVSHRPILAKAQSWGIAPNFFGCS